MQQICKALSGSSDAGINFRTNASIITQTTTKVGWTTPKWTALRWEVAPKSPKDNRKDETSAALDQKQYKVIVVKPRDSGLF